MIWVTVTKEINRRDFLTLAWKGLLALSGFIGLAGVLRFLSFKPGPESPSEFDLGPAEGYPPGSKIVYEAAPALIIQDSDGFRALSLVCPHLGCTVKVAGGGFECPCHGSQFDADGGLLRGPAREPLEELRIDLTQEGRLILHR